MSALFKVYRGKAEKMPEEMHDGYLYFTTDTGKIYIDAIVNGSLKRTLINPDPNSGNILSNTKEGWDAQPSLVTEKNTIYVYTDYYQDQDGTLLPGLKIGDGNAYLIDTPFIDSKMMDHIYNTSIHITEEQRRFWNNKVRCQDSEIQNQTIIFTIH